MNLAYLERDEASAEFFDHAASGALALQQCVCGQWVGPDRRSCPQCRGAQLNWMPVAGQGTLVTWTVVHGHPAGPGEPPSITAVGVVELPEGPWITGRLADISPSQLCAGLPVVVAFERPPEGEAVPVWRPTPRTEAASAKG